jgi:hypothetical protein
MPLVFITTGDGFTIDSILTVCPYTGSFITERVTLIFAVVIEEHDKPDVAPVLDCSPAVRVIVE